MGVLNRLFTDAHYLWGLEKKLKGFDLVHTAETYYNYTQQSLHAKQKGYVKKVVATVLENIPFNNEGIAGRQQFKKNAREHLDHIIALTKRTKMALLLEGADEKKITVVPHFIDTKRFKPHSRLDSESNGDINILFCGRLEVYKGIYELLYALSLLKKDEEIAKVSWRCTFVGMGSEIEGMKRRVYQLGLKSFVFFETASYEEMPKKYAQADIYCAPSKTTDTWQEQYNTTLLEAQACGLPIVTTESGGIVENVGDAALLVQAGDVLSLYHALKQLILHKNVRIALGKKARIRAVQVHDIAIGAEKISTIYDKVLCT